MMFLIFLADQATEIGAPILTGSAIASVLGWFMWQNNKRMDESRDAINRLKEAVDEMSRVQLIQMMAHPDFPEKLKPPAQQLLNDLPK